MCRFPKYLTPIPNLNSKRATSKHAYFSKNFKFQTSKHENVHQLPLPQ